MTGLASIERCRLPFVLGRDAFRKSSTDVRPCVGYFAPGEINLLFAVCLVAENDGHSDADPQGECCPLLGRLHRSPRDPDTQDARPPGYVQVVLALPALEALMLEHWNTYTRTPVQRYAG